eukprot:6447400-Prymnesium_polylepis.1
MPAPTAGAVPLPFPCPGAAAPREGGGAQLCRAQPARRERPHAGHARGVAPPAVARPEHAAGDGGAARP